MTNECEKRIENWVNKADGQEIILVIGSGFSRNAILNTMHRPVGADMPVWNTLLSKVQEELTGDATIEPPDKLFLFDIYRDQYGEAKYESLLKSSVPDDDISPGEVHHYLTKIPRIRAIITTNNIDTLLKKTFPNAKEVVRDTDVIQMLPGDLEIVYLHGNRSSPESWIYSRTDYEEIEKNYPLKTALCSRLMATFPSIFIGFGYYDQDIHSIMRFVNKASGAYTPPMLSLAVEDANTALVDYWHKMKLEVANVHEHGGDISYELLNALKYVNEKRITALKEKGLLRQGYRIEDSYMDRLVKKKLDCCVQGKGKIKYCEYHKNRQNAEIIRIKEQLPSISGYTSIVLEGSKMMKLIKRLQKGDVISGSWGLMRTHRNWLEKWIRNEIRKGEAISLIITGIAGLSHFVDTMSIIIPILNQASNVEIFVIDICIGPIEDIRGFLAKKNRVAEPGEKKEYMEVYNYCRQANVKVEFKNHDILNKLPGYENHFDIALSHHLITDMGMVERKTKEYVINVFEMLKPDGILILAQNLGPEDEDVVRFQNMMIDTGYVPIDSEKTFDAYDHHGRIDLIEINGQKGMFVDKETLLTVHRKAKVITTIDTK